MKDFGDILDEIRDTADEDGNIVKRGLSPDQLRYKYLKELYKLTDRNVITYYSGFLQPGRVNTSITDSDMIGFISAVSNMDTSKGLDLILHTPGGDPTATEGIVKFLHNKFGNNIRVIVPQMAMSAGTMMACSAKTIMMGSHSFLGPTDPQMFGGIPAYNIIEEYEHAMDDLKANPDRNEYWSIELDKYPPGFYYYVLDILNVSKTQVQEWLKNYMFGDQTDKNEVNKTVRKITKTLIRGEQLHAKHFDIKDCQKMGLKVENLEDEKYQELNEAITYLHYAYIISIDMTKTAKFIENQFGKSYIELNRKTSEEGD